jgi:hypothetical protein
LATDYHGFHWNARKQQDQFKNIRVVSAESASSATRLLKRAADQWSSVGLTLGLNCFVAGDADGAETARMKSKRIDPVVFVRFRGIRGNLFGVCSEFEPRG